MNSFIPITNKPGHPARISDDRMEYIALRRRFVKLYDEEAEINELIKNWKRPVYAEVKSEVLDRVEAPSSTLISEDAYTQATSNLNVEAATAEDPRTSEAKISDLNFEAATLKSEDVDKSETAVSDLNLKVAASSLTTEDAGKFEEQEASDVYIEATAPSPSLTSEIEVDTSEAKVSDLNSEAATLKSEDMDKSEAIVSDVNLDDLEAATLKSEDAYKSENTVSDVIVHLEAVTMKSDDDVENPLLLETKEEAELVVKSKAGTEEEDEDTGGIISFWGIH